MNTHKIKYKSYIQEVDVNTILNQCTTLLELSEKFLELHEECIRDGYSSITYNHSYDYCTINIFGYREETDAEYKQRIEDQEKAAQQERELYEQLKAKYEPN